MATTQLVPAQHGGAIAPQSKRDIDALLKSDQFKSAVAAALPKHVTPDRFVRVALTAMMRQPKLRECTQESLFKCLLDLSSLGLEPDGRRAHLIPFKRNWKDDQGKWHSTMDVQLIVDYKGIAELVRRSGDVSYIHADVVYERDEFDYAFGSGAFLKHKPNFDDRGEKISCFYSFVKLKDGSEDFIVMSKPDVDKVRARSKAKDDGPWVTDYDEMGKKTVFRRHSKWLPLSPETRDAIEKDDEAIDMRISDTPDGDPLWLQTGSVKAAHEVGEAKIAEMEAAADERERQAMEQIQQGPAAERPTLKREPPAVVEHPEQFKSWEAWERCDSPVHPLIQIHEGPNAGTFRWDEASGSYKVAETAEEQPKPRQAPRFGRRA